MRVGYAMNAKLRESENTYANAFTIEKLIRQDMNGIGGLYVGTEIAECRPPHLADKSRDFGVELMIPYGRGMESDRVHQSRHRVRRFFVGIVQRVARTIITG